MPIARRSSSTRFTRPASAGSRCISCHMSDVNWRLLIRRRDHTFQPPVPEMTAAFGVPNACTTCHDDRTPEWAARQMDQWWGDGARRKASLALADTMYRAGSGDARVLPALARLAVDRIARRPRPRERRGVHGAARARHGGHARAPTRRARRRFGRWRRERCRRAQRCRTAPVTLSVAQINALIGAAADPEPMVRAQAVNALLATGIAIASSRRSSRGCRSGTRRSSASGGSAAVALGSRSCPEPPVRRCDGRRTTTRRACSDFPDVAGNHAALGWLEVRAEPPAQAQAALDTAIRLDPRAARPLVDQGRDRRACGRLHRGAWSCGARQDRSTPTYPNIDQLDRGSREAEDGRERKGPSAPS